MAKAEADLVDQEQATVRTREDFFGGFISEDPTETAVKESATALAKLIYSVYKNPEENGIMINGQNETYDEEDSN